MTTTKDTFGLPLLAHIYQLIEDFVETLPEDSAEESALRAAMSKVDEADMCLKGITIAQEQSS